MSIFHVLTIKAAGGKAVAAVTSAEDGEGIVKTAMEKFGAVHVLAANVGMARPSPVEKMSEKDWDEVIAVNLRYAVCRFSKLRNTANYICSGLFTR